MGKLPEEVMVEELKVNFNRPVHEERLLFKGFQDNGAEKVSQEIKGHHKSGHNRPPSSVMCPHFVRKGIPE